MNVEDLLALPARVAALEAHLAQTQQVQITPDHVGILWRPHLTDKELEVLTCLAAGLTHQEIAAHQCTTSATARTHVGNIISRTQSINSRGAMIYGLLSGRVAQADVAALLQQYRPHYFMRG